MDDISISEETLDTVEFALINLVKGHPELYNSQDPTSRDKRKKDLAWANIASQLNRDEGWCYAKWKNLADYYKKRRKIYERGTTSGTGRRWVYYDALSFLDFYEANREEAGFTILGHVAGEHSSQSSTDCGQVFLDDTQYQSLDGIAERAQDYPVKRRRITTDTINQNLPESVSGNRHLTIVQSYGTGSHSVESHRTEDPIHIPCGGGDSSRIPKVSSGPNRTNTFQDGSVANVNTQNCPHYHFCQSLLVRLKNMSPANATYTQMKIMEILLKTEFPDEYRARTAHDN